MDIPFESFAKLVYRLGNPPKRQLANGSSAKSTSLSPSKIFQSWLNHLPEPFPGHTGKHLLRLLFPHEGSRRRYGLKEAKLAQELEKVLQVKGLTRWDSVCWDAGGEGGAGCLGKEVELLMKDRMSSSSSKSTLSIREVDHLLDELASASPFSQLSQTPHPVRSASDILKDLYRASNLTPYALAVLTQVILRDLRPLLSPLPKLPIRNPTAMLRLKSTAGPGRLTVRDAMLCWDKRMWDLYVGGRGDMDRCADLVEGLAEKGADHKQVIAPGPVVGVNVKIPKCRKGRSVSDALSEFNGTSWAPPAREIWAETKYDGYRMQTHVDASCPGSEPRITLFSKSTRDSTQDRLNTHSIILAALGLPIAPHLPTHLSLKERTGLPYVRQRNVRSVILEAEVVPYNESNREGGRDPGIEEFWWLGHAGVTANPLIRDFFGSGMPRNRSRHLCLVFFDVLLVNGESLLHHTYEARRAILEEVIRPIPGFSTLAERTRISLDLYRHDALQALKESFERSTSRREEGLVLKASNSTYTNMRWQWVKLKKDYIPNLGDCIDLVLLGAGWDKDRARELRVDTSVFTTFYIGVLTNSERVKTKREMPNFEILFRASYGLDRSALEVYNGEIRHGRWASKSYDKDDPFKRRLLGLSWTYIMPRGMCPPSVLFQSPLCAEVMGAGFQKLPGSELYELRWPRLQKIYDPSDRPWTQALTAPELLRAAHKSLGYMSPPVFSPRSPDDSIKALWRSSSTFALIDIPELVSPISSSSNRRTGKGSPMKRVRSAPELELAGDGDVEVDVKDEPLSPTGLGDLSDVDGDDIRSLDQVRMKRRRLMTKAISFGDAGKRLKEIMGDAPNRYQHLHQGGNRQSKIAENEGASARRRGDSSKGHDEAHTAAQVLNAELSASTNSRNPQGSRDGLVVLRKHILQPAFVPCTPTPAPLSSSAASPCGNATTSIAAGTNVIGTDVRFLSTPLRERVGRHPTRNAISNVTREHSSPTKKLISTIDWSLADLTAIKTISEPSIPSPGMTSMRTRGRPKDKMTVRGAAGKTSIHLLDDFTKTKIKDMGDITGRTEKNRPLSLRSRLRMLAKSVQPPRTGTNTSARARATVSSSVEGSLENRQAVEAIC
ncbi:hypothetical protein IAU59_003220 [Kwoniella sp. CBS 9459]